MRSRSPKSPLPTLRHTLTASHPDYGLGFDDAIAAAERRGDITLDMTLRLDHLPAVSEWLSTRAVMILRGPHPLTMTHDRIMLTFVRPWEAEDFRAWIDSREVMARLLGLTA